MDVLEEDSLESIMERLNRVAPPGLEVLGGKEMPEKVKKMMAICNFAIYEVTGPVRMNMLIGMHCLNLLMKQRKFLMKR